MKKIIVEICLMTLLMLPAVVPAVGPINEKQIVCSTIHDNPLDGGWIEVVNGIKVLHISGSYYDMGYQHGYLLKNELQENLRAQLIYFEDHSYPYDKILSTWHLVNTRRKCRAWQMVQDYPLMMLQC